MSHFEFDASYVKGPARPGGEAVIPLKEAKPWSFAKQFEVGRASCILCFHMLPWISGFSGFVAMTSKVRFISRVCNMQFDSWAVIGG